MTSKKLSSALVALLAAVASALKKLLRSGAGGEAEIAWTIEVDGNGDEHQCRLRQELDDFSERSFR